MLGISSAIKQYNAALPGRFQEKTPGLAAAIQLGKVAAPEFVPLGRVVAEPAAQFVAWSHVLQPSLQVQVLLLYASRPDTVYKELNTVHESCHIVHTLDLDHVAYLLQLPIGP